VSAALLATAIAFGLIILRAPVGLSLLAGSATGILVEQPDVENVIGLLSYRIFDNFALLAAPLFIVAANLLLGSGALDTLLRGLHRLGKRRWLVPPGVVGMAMFFAGITGSSIAEAAAFGKLVYPAMRFLGFPSRKIAGLIAAAATLGVLLPPSLTLIFYGTITQTPVSQLFLASLLPGVLSVALLAITSIFLVRPEVGPAPQGPIAPEPAQGEEPLAVSTLSVSYESGPDSSAVLARPTGALASTLSGAKTVRSALTGVIAAAPLVIVFGGIYGGFATPSEVAALLVIYGVLVMLFLRGHQGVTAALEDGASVTASVFMIIMGATAFSFVATLDGVPQRIASTVVSAHLSRIEFILVLSAILFVLGGFLDGLSILLVTVPLVFPAALQLGISPIQLGILMAINIEHAAIMPPVGINLFIVSAVSGLSYRDTVRSVLAWYPVSIVVLILVAFFPWLTTGIWGH
jgi:C4-dicarboxylate transporter, DctM subunit